MKKAVAISVIAIYFLAILTVNFLGLKITIFDGNTYVSEIVCESVTLQADDGRTVKMSHDDEFNTTNFIFEFKDGAYDEDNIGFNPNAVVINYRVYPDNATSKGVKYVYDRDSINGVAVFKEDKSTLIFLSKGGVSIDITATDGSNINAKIFIYAR